MSDPTTQRMMMGSASDQGEKYTVNFGLYSIGKNSTTAIEIGSSFPAAGNDSSNKVKMVSSKDGRYLAVANGNAGIKIYEVSGVTATEILSETSSNAAGCAFTPDGEYLFVSDAAVIRVYRNVGGSFTRQTDQNQSYTITDMAMSSDGVYLAVSMNAASGQNPLRVFKRSGGTLTALTVADPSIGSGGKAVAFSPNTNHLVIQTYSSSKLYKRNGDAFTVLSVPPFDGSSTIVGAYTGAGFLAYSADGSYFAMTSVNSATNPDQYRILIYQVSGDAYNYIGQAFYFAPTTTFRFHSLCWSKKNNLLALTVLQLASYRVYMYRMSYENDNPVAYQVSVPNQSSISAYGVGASFIPSAVYGL